MTAGGAKPIVEVRSGAHLYGTATPASDFDTKSVFLPAARDILLQQVRASIVDSRDRAPGERSAPGDLDFEAHSLHRFLNLLAAGQPLAIEVLFTPDAFMLSAPDRVWREVQAIGPSLITRRAGVFARYCRKQAEHYGVKGERAAAARTVLGSLTAAEAAHGPQVRLEAIAAELEALATASPHIAIVDVEVQEHRTVRHLEVSGRKAPFTATVRAAREMAERLVAGYGARALEAERRSGVDWKALSHAVRVGREAVELFTTGRLRFPLASAPRLLDIKLGRVPYAEVVGEIERLLGEVEQSAATSTLPDEPDLMAAEALVIRAYRDQVLESLE
ncbi:DNA polymerase beta superfamily protein [Lichenicoccus sp.]|uniref:DNA polymerase beta superfamily protein n=1 Tax=Lichenicoccus sp. TaxID=2781899 RepID=UPI003D0DDB9D